MTCDEIMQEVVNGTVTALFWAALIWIANHVRNWRAEHQLRRALSEIGVTQGADCFGVTVKNSSNYEITVRDVTLLSTKPEEGFSLLFAGQSYEYMFQEKPFKDPRKITLHQRRASRPAQPLLESSAQLGPHTTGTWKVHISVFVDHPDLVPNRCHLAAQYRTLLGNPKILVVESNDRCSKFIQESFQRQMAQVKQQQVG